MIKTRIRLSAAAIISAALFAAGCGSSSSSSTPSSTQAATTTTSSSSTSAAAGVSVGTAKGKDGTYLTGPTGRALYLWVVDPVGKSTCSGACAQAWPPLTTTGAPAASNGAIAGDLGTITRADGKKQVTYKGHPLYYFAGDSNPGMLTGQGSNSFGAKWWLVAPSGAAITGSGSSSGSGGSTTSSSGGGWG